MATLLRLSLLLTVALGFSALNAQTSTEFWFAAPEVTSGHVTDNPILLRMASGANAASITIDMPANGSFTPISISLAANSSASQDLSAFLADIETGPMDQVLNSGLRVISDQPITAYYEVNTGFNPDIFALKGLTGLGTEFYTPFQDTYDNGNYSPTPYTSFDIVATEDDTQVIIYARVDLEGGHNALNSYIITLDQGQTYSGGVLDRFDPNPTGTAIAADKPIAVSIKDDSVQLPSGCRDLVGDQLVPVDIMGTQYIVNKGALTTPDQLVITATENVTTVSIGGVYQTTLFTGETYEYFVNDALTFVETSKPVYAFHVTGFGCEVGGALLPPLNCAGSEQVSFTRSTTESFFLNLLVRNGSQGDFEIDGDATLIEAADFTIVPGSGDEWVGAQIQYTTEVAVDQAYLVTNSSNVFALGLINGGGSSGCRFGYFSEFAAQIYLEAGTNDNVCANELYALAGSVSGGTTTGIWTTSGSGTFSPDAEALDAIYEPSAQDILNGSVTLTLTSTGQCTPVDDSFVLSFVPAPITDAGADQTACGNASTVTLDGTIQNALGGIWSGGDGLLSDNTDLNSTYTPTTDEINLGTVTLTLTSTGNGICEPDMDMVTITYGPSPTAEAGAPLSVCANNADAQLAGSITIAGGAIWSGGLGSFSPSNTNLNAIYSPTQTEIDSGSLSLTLTTTDNDGCISVSDNVNITFTTAPSANAGSDQAVCINNPEISLSGSVSIATEGVWSGGAASFWPSNTDLNATYTPTDTELTSGAITLTLTTTDGGGCLEESDDITITFDPAPAVEAGSNQEVCADNPTVTLSGSVSIATGGTWSAGGTSFFPSASSLNATYNPTNAEVSAGQAWIYLTSTGNDDCLAVTDSLLLTINPIPIVEAGLTQTVCGNNATVLLAGQVWNAGGGQWSGGTGSYSPSSAFLDAQYAPSQDEIDAGVVILTLTSTNNEECNAVSDQVQINIFPSPEADAGSDENICRNNADISLDGSVQNAAGGFWTGAAGTYSPSATSLSAVYTPTQDELDAGSVTLTLTTSGISSGCLEETDQVTFTFTNGPTVDAGDPVTVCANAATVSLSPIITNASGGVWSGGSGAFGDANVLNTSYDPNQSEINAGSVTLTLTTTGNGNCSPESDTITITITPAPVVSAGSDQVICEDDNQVSLSGSITGAVTSGSWASSGTGVFSPNNLQLNATYLLSEQDILNGGVTLSLSSDVGANCAPVVDSAVITITEGGAANAGPDQTLCSNNATATMAATVGGNATVGTWTTAGTGGFSSMTATNATYSPSAADLSNGSVLLTFTLNSCDAASDDIELTFTPSPTANAGSDIDICANNAMANLGGTVSVASGGIWSGGNGSFSPSESDLDASYAPTAGEIDSGSVTLTLTTTDSGDCLEVSDQVTITISPAPSVSAGSDQVICEDDNQVSLSGSISGAVTSGSWGSSGTGVFSPNNLQLNATYLLSDQDILNGGVTLTLSSNTGANCNPVDDSVVITVTAGGIADAGPDQTLCSNNATAAMAAIVGGNATAGTWTTAGTGGFSSLTATNATYTPSAADLSNESVLLTFTLNSCDAASDDIELTFTPSPTANAGSDIDICANNATANLGGTVSIASGGLWSGGNGSFSPSESDLDASYAPTTGEINSGSVTLTLTTTGSGDCLEVSDQVTITILPAPVANAGADHTVCASADQVSLSGAISGESTTGSWNTNGTGVFSPNNFDLNATYILSEQDSLNGGAVLTLTSTNHILCNAVSDDVEIFLTPAGFVDVGMDLEVCENNPTIDLTATLSGNTTSGTWGSSGSGSFGAITALNTSYTPSADDLTSESLTLSFTSNGCNAHSDDLVLTILPSPTADAGGSSEICANNPTLSLSGSVVGATGGAWSGGNGTFLPSADDLDATYTPSQGEIDSGSFALTLTTTGNGTCLGESDLLTITVTDPPTVNAGPDDFLCASEDQVPLSGTVSGTTTTGSWSSSGTGIFSPNTQDLNATYILSEQDIFDGGVIITLTSTDNGLCSPVEDSMEVLITGNGWSDAGEDLTVCANNSLVSLNGSISGNATAAVWSTSGDGSFANATNLATDYTPGTNDLLAGSVTLSLTPNGCNDFVDELTLTITPSPVVNAGNDLTACANALDIALAGSVSGASNTGVWSTSGTGAFSPDANALNASYEASEADASFGSVTLTLQATGIGDCSAVSDQMVISILPEVDVSAGEDQSHCANNTNIQLDGSASDSEAIVWSTSGSGTFSPSESALNASYLPSEADLLSGGIFLTIEAVNSCNNADDVMEITITPAPVVNAGGDQQLCESNPEVTLAGAITGATSTGVWSTTGTGSFGDINDLTTDYIPSVADVNAGQVTLSLTSTNNGNCNPVQDQLEVYFSDGVQADAGSDQQVCVDATSIQLNGQIINGSPTGTWSTSGTGDFNNPDILNAQYTFSPGDIADGVVQLTLTTTNTGDCDPDSDIMIITFGDTAFASAGDDQSICVADGSTQLNGFASGGSSTGEWTSSGSGTFEDNTMGNTSYTPSASDVSDGQVELTFTTTNNGSCEAGQDTMLLTIDGVPSANAGADQVICGDIVEINAEAGFANAESILWSSTGSGDFTSPADQATVGYLPSEADSIIGSFELVVQTQGLTACDHVTDTLLVQFGGGFSVNAGEDDRICESNGSYDLVGSAEGDNLTYSWTSNGSGSIADPSAITTTYTLGASDTGDVEFVLSAQDGFGCSPVIDVFVLTVDNEAEVNAGPDATYCSSIESFGLVGTTANAGAFSWTTTGTGTIDDPLAENTLYSPSEADAIIGEVIFTLTSDADNGCGQTEDSFTVILDNSVIAGFSFTPACLGDPTRFTNATVITSGTVESLTWDFGGLGTSSSENPDWIFTEPGIYDVTLTVELTEGCSSTITQQIEVTEPPVADFGYNGILLADEEVEFFDLTPNSTQWYWEFGIGSDTASIEDPKYEFNFEGTYEVMLIATDANGCQDTITKILTVDPGDILPPKTPTGFSPNGDGENDVYYVRGGPFKEISFTIYNGWGEAIFNSTDPLIGWDGTHKGKDQPVGVYIYTIKAKTVDDQEFDKSGKVTLIR